MHLSPGIPTPLLVPHVVDFVEDEPLDLAHNLRAAVQHRPQNLRRHDEARRVRVDSDVAGHQANVAELLEQVAVLLVGQRLDRRRVNNALLVAQGHRDRVLCDDGLSR